MIYQLLEKIDKLMPFSKASAHCDVPCGIYDPIPAQIAAMTVARMTDTLIELEKHEVDDHKSERDLHYQNKLTRMVHEKERSATIVKDEVTIIWGDFYKQPQFDKYPDLHQQVHQIMLTASKCKQNVDQQASRDLVNQLNAFAARFWEIKGIKSKEVTYHCKPGLQIVMPEL